MSVPPNYRTYHDASNISGKKQENYDENIRLHINLQWL
jgi:hypothetical protein